MKAKRCVAHPKTKAKEAPQSQKSLEESFARGTLCQSVVLCEAVVLFVWKFQIKEENNRV